MAEFRAPNKLTIGSDENPASKWHDWIEQFNLYMDIQTNDYTDKQKVSLLLYSMGAEYMPVYKTFDFTNSSDRDKIDVVKTKFNEYFEPKKLLKKQLTMFQARVILRRLNLTFWRPF